MGGPEPRPCFTAQVMIAVDWGSTNFRATLLDESKGTVIDRVSSADGIRKHRNQGGRAFEETLLQLCGKWIENHDSGKEIILSGMIGSREGWVEAPYVPTPCDAVDLAAALTPLSLENATGTSLTAWIVPGVRHELTAEGDCDVMRGEETEVTGLLSARKLSEKATICIPGTHSKWVLCCDKKITAFQTWLTGEAFDQLTTDSLISGTKEHNSLDEPAFFRGLDRSGKSGGLLHHLFLGRTDMLMKQVAPESLSSLISGLLIGHEIREAIRFAGDGGPVYLIGKSAASRAYGKAFAHFGIEFVACEEDVHTAGILEISAARSHG